MKAIKRCAIRLLVLLVVALQGGGCIANQPVEQTPPLTITQAQAKRFIVKTKPTKENLIVVYFEDYAPFSWKDENGEMQGMLVEYMQELLVRRMGLDVEHRGFPWARAQEMVKQGEADVFVSVPTEARREYTFVSEEPVYINHVAVFAKKDNPRIEELRKITNLEDLHSFTTSTYTGNSWAETNLSMMKIVWVSTPQQALEMLAAGRVDVYIDSSFVTNYLLSKMNLDTIEEMPNPVNTTIFHFFIGKKSPYVEILPEVDKQIKQLKQEDWLKSLRDR